MVLGLYWRSKASDFKSKYLLWGFRFLFILGVLALLLGPRIRQLITETKKPSVVMLFDNSQSVDRWLQKVGDNNISEALHELGSSLSTDYHIDTYAFGDGIHSRSIDSLTYQAQSTDISGAIGYVTDVYEGEHLGAIILASDGIYNSGQNPLYTGLSAQIPIYSVALGDTSVRRDLSIQSVLHNEVAYLNDEMITQIDIKGINTSGQSTRLVVEKENESGGYDQIHTENINLIGNDFFTTIAVNLEFDQVGIQHYRYRLSGLSNESNVTNNTQSVYIEILDARQQIALIAGAPHPDITAIKSLLSANKNYDLSIHYEVPNRAEIIQFDLVILHDLPSPILNISGLLTTLDQTKTPRVYILGGGISKSDFNRVQSLVTIEGGNSPASNTQAIIDDDFDYFTISDALKGQLSRYPPLASPYGTYDVNGAVRTLLYQSIGGIATDFPLLSFADIEGIKTCYIFGADLWRWKLYDFLQNENFEIISELLDKSILYTSTREDKRKFRVSSAKNVYLINDDIIFSAELYNNSYELINEAEVSISLSTANDSKYDYTFSRSQSSYTLNAGQLDAGKYSYEATTTFNGEKFAAEGSFVVQDIQYELFDLEAKHDIMLGLAAQTNGLVVYPEAITSLADVLKNQKKIKPVIYQNEVSKSLIENKWALLLLLIPLILEWAIRRYQGSL